MATFVLCGGDNVGKTTIAKKLAATTNIPYFKFPYGSDNDTIEDVYSGKRIRSILNGEFQCDPIAFQALQLINKMEAIPHLRKLEQHYGAVIVDRWNLSAVIYGAIDGVDIVWNTKICKFFDDQIKPSLMFVLTGKPFKIDKDIYGQHQEEIQKMYLDYVAEHADDPSVIEIKIIDENGKHKSQNSIGFEILTHIVKYFTKEIHDLNWAKNCEYN
jgi:thymidylate kinase